MSDDESVHADLTIRCGAELTDDDGEPITKEQELHEDHPDAPGTTEVAQHCDTEMVFRDHGRFVRNPRGKDRHGTRLSERFTQDALKFVCPDCGAATWVCPVCSGDDAGGAPGWFRGEDTGDMLPCHNCNMEEVQRQRRDPHSGVSY